MQIETTKTRVINVISSTLKVSNVDLAISYAFKGDGTRSTPAAFRLQNDIVAPAHADAQVTCLLNRTPNVIVHKNHLYNF